MNRIFVDTSGWMAMADSKDPLHIKSLEARDEWFEQGGILVTSNFDGPVKSQNSDGKVKSSLCKARES